MPAKPRILLSSSKLSTDSLPGGTPHVFRSGMKREGFSCLPRRTRLGGLLAKGLLQLPPLSSDSVADCSGGHLGLRIARCLKPYASSIKQRKAVAQGLAPAVAWKALAGPLSVYLSDCLAALYIYIYLYLFIYLYLYLYMYITYIYIYLYYICV